VIEFIPPNRSGPFRVFSSHTPETPDMPNRVMAAAIRVTRQIDRLLWRPEEISFELDD
jgi:hypothetical protein